MPMETDSKTSEIKNVIGYFNKKYPKYEVVFKESEDILCNSTIGLKDRYFHIDPHNKKETKNGLWTVSDMPDKRKVKKTIKDMFKELEQIDTVGNISGRYVFMSWTKDRKVFQTVCVGKLGGRGGNGQ
jgi:hypothetical protein